MILRPYQSTDCPALARLFYETVHTVNARDYTRQQLDAWATGQVELPLWDRAFREHCTLVAEQDGQLLGFGDMDDTGYLDRLFVHKDHQGKGIATALCDRLEAQSTANIFTAEVSVTARPFFEKRGYRVVRQQNVERNGVFLTNFLMEKENI